MPAPTPQPGRPQVQCRLIRSKWMFIDVEPDPKAPHSDNGLYWCVHTQNCLGPDGKIVTLEKCAFGRACFEPL